jgi:RimJ/RimL family protein N-acetyltransferase
MDTRLRAVTRDDLPLLERLFTDPHAAGELNWFGRAAVHDLAQQLDEDGMTSEDGGRLIVEVSGAGAVGMVSWHATPYGPGRWSRAWNIGIGLLPDARGQGVGTAAQRLLAEELLATTTVNRVEASTDVDNVAERRALEKAGFTREGILRGAQFRAGSWHDLVGYSLLRGE